MITFRSFGQDASKVFDTSYSYETAASGGTSDSDQLQTATDTLSGKVTTYGYEDPAGKPSMRLTGVTQSGGTGDVNWAYTYDADGNRTEAKSVDSVTGAVKSDQTLSFNAANQITSSGYTYDAAGNLTASPGATYTYNGAEQLTSATVNGVTTNYTYAGASQSELLTESTAGGVSYAYTYGKSGRVGVPEIDTETSAGHTSRVSSDGSTGQAVDLTGSDGATAAFLVDGLGNQVGALTDAGSVAFQALYDPYGGGGVILGNTSEFWTQNPYGFKAGDRTSDQGGLVKFGIRWYLPGVGAWTQEDTLDSPLDPNNANRYAYAGDDPINNLDASGASAAGDQVGILAGSITGIAVGGAVCAFTAGVGCAAGASLGIFLGSAIGGAAGEAASTAYDGGSTQKISDAALDGLGKGAEAGFLPALVPLAG